MFWIIPLVVIATTLWVVVDSRKNKIPTYGEVYTLNTGALTWFIGCALLWVCAFPLYLCRRQKFLKKRFQMSVPPMTPAQVISAQTVNLESELRTLAKLAAENILSEEEFTLKKRQLLGLS